MAARVGSTQLETHAVLLACCTWGPEWRGKVILIQSDNLGAVAAIERKHSSHPRIAGTIRAINTLALHYNFVLHVQWIRGESNVLADAVSRSQDARLQQLLPNQRRVYPVINPLQDWKRICERS
jgi:hypothetical protein